MREMTQTVPVKALNNGVDLPVLGFGTYQMPASVTQECVEEALSLGYRAIDTAQCYGNETQVGRAIARSGIDRSEVFVTTKTWTNGYLSTKAGIKRSVNALGGYADLLLIHEPTSDIAGTWRALEEAYSTGIVRAIGVSNFMGSNLDKLLSTAKVAPAVDQVETHVYRQQRNLQRQLDALGIALQSWSPLACGAHGVFSDPVLEGIAKSHNKTIAQVALRWLLQRGIPLNAKSTHVDRMRQNLDVFDFELTASEMNRIESLDTCKSLFGWW